MTGVLKSNPLALIIDLEKRVRNALTIDELGFLIVNETYNLVKYRQAILFDDMGNIRAISGTSNFEKNSPFIYWLKRHLSPLSKDLSSQKEINKETLETVTDSAWEEWLPQNGIFLPITSPLQGKMGSLFLARDKSWNNNEKNMLNILADIYGHSWGAFRKVKFFGPIKNIRSLAIVSAIIGLIFLFLIPVPLTVLAPSEIVAINPSVIRAPIKGVVEKIMVTPNQLIKKGDVLFYMDSLSQRNDLDIAQKVFISLKVQYAQLARQALSDITSKKFLTETLGHLKEQEIRIANLKQLIKRMEVLAPRSGTVIIDDPGSWEGRPVNLGEKIISLADQGLVEVESWLSVADVIDLKKDASIRLYLNSKPLSPISASLRSFSYKAQQRPGDIFAHRIRAKIIDVKSMPRLGLRGTARISGEDVSIIYWIFRRPFSALRQFLGF